MDVWPYNSSYFYANFPPPNPILSETPSLSISAIKNCLNFLNSHGAALPLKSHYFLLLYFTLHALATQVSL